MRAIGIDEKKKRGCRYCLEYKHIKGVGNMCKHDKCPYHELDDYDTYEDFFKAQGSVLEELLGEEQANDYY